MEFGQILDAHGGLAHWRRVVRVEARVKMGGPLFWTKFRPAALKHFSLELFPQEDRLELVDFPRVGESASFTPAGVRHGRAERTEARRHALGSLRWDDLDEIYFAGYALWNYLSTPFLLVREGVQLHRRNEQSWDVTFPAGFETHCQRQRFWFGADGLLRRLDYHAEVFGPLARGAHICTDHVECGGLMIPARRRVFPRLLGRPVGPLPVIHGWVEPVRVETR